MGTSAPAPGGWEGELERWLAPFLAALSREAQRRWAVVYLKGLILPGERKSVEPLAARVAPGSAEQLHRLIGGSPWATGPLEAVLAREADRLVGGPDAALVVDDTALPKQGRHSVGVARQCCGCRGKRANGQVLVSLTLARAEVPVTVGLRLFLPEGWTGDSGRCAGAGVPEEQRRARAKTEIALEEIDRLVAAGVRFGRAVADAGYGASAAFRQGLSERGLAWAVGVLKTQNVYPPTVGLRWPVARTGRPRKRPVPSEDPVPAEQALAGAGWRRVSWRRGTMIGRADHPSPPGRRRQRRRGGPLGAEFAALRVRPADGAQPRDGRHLPGEEVWLVGEHRPSGERKYYLANLPPDAALEELAATIKARWVCEQAHQQLKEELGLDHFEGRSWRGLHHHALLCRLALAFLQHLRLRERGEKPRRVTRTATAADAAGGAAPRPGRADARAPALPPLPAALRPPPPALNVPE
jgi:SRSO17 transposase